MGILDDLSFKQGNFKMIYKPTTSLPAMAWRAPETPLEISIARSLSAAGFCQPADAVAFFVPPSIFARGEDWVRETYKISPDIPIRESLPLS